MVNQYQKAYQYLLTYSEQFSLESLKQKLIEMGYSEEIVEQAASDLRSELTQKNMPSGPQKFQRLPQTNREQEKLNHVSEYSEEIKGSQRNQKLLIQILIILAALSVTGAIITVAYYVITKAS
jgi:hypothetical protein